MRFYSYYICYFFSKCSTNSTNGFEEIVAHFDHLAFIGIVINRNL